MIVALNEEHKQHLSFLSSVSADVVREFCQIAVEFMKKEPNQKAYNSASQKLGVEADTVRHAVEGLIHLFTSLTAQMVSEQDLTTTLLPLAMPEEVSEVIKEYYLSESAEIRSILTHMSVDVAHYHDLQWRLDVKVASRTLRQQTDPIITLKLKTKNGDEIQSQVLQTDPVNLLHLTSTLEDALNELKTPHCRRILRNL
ncbi:hypothetical protein CAPTEDRAFT_180041 [Capitella teleta]|uniref:COMM domain-containing protein n=1 Tax=Capitella teleta TaxID=283909 RepID=R7U272_CAPTE|nr:hypothetical protein CAPTEDRAFT_180041 [Capitella teleta]|eukprot:ELT97761.1 hypothetical protein CAPTEDRAFT_180041 [Capitella teleta]